MARRGLWPRLLELQPRNNGPWCYIGDFNEMISSNEKDGLRPIEPGRTERFRDFLNKSELIDLELHGSKFTWINNPRDGFFSRERVDRALANWSWRQIFPHAMVLALPIVNSDHAPLVLKPKPNLQSGRSFKYDAFWEDHEDCRRRVQEGWSSNHFDVWNRWSEKANNCKTELSRCHQRTFRNAAKQIGLLKKSASEVSKFFCRGD